MPRVLVIGGGVAGITAALDCASAGAQVTLVEVRRRLGGAAYSFERDGLRIDNGQHVFLRCCVAYRALLSRLGSEARVFVQPRLEIPVLRPGSPVTVLRRGSLPAPAHLLGALARYPHLTRAQRLSAARSALALRRLSRNMSGDRGRALDGETLGGWLSRRGQGEAAMSALWDLIALPTLNLPAAQASLQLGAFVFGEGLFSRADAADIGFHRATLGETIGEPAAGALEAAGVAVRLGWRAQALRRSASGYQVDGRAARRAHAEDQQGAQLATGRQNAGTIASELRDHRRPDAGPAETLSAEAVIVALPHARAAALIEPLLGDIAGRLRMLESSPIVNLHVVYDRPVLEHSFAAGVETPVQYLFDRSEAAGAPPGSQYLAVSLSGAERDMAMTVDGLRERYLPALSALLPRARSAGVERFLVTREHAATFRAAPGVAALRPGVKTPLRGLALAGAWTDTGWPATLEGAVLSGHAAAGAALGTLELGPRAPVGTAVAG